MPADPTTASRALPLRLREVGRTFGRDVLRGLDLDVTAGEIIAIVGTPEGRARLLDLGAEIIGGTPADFAAFLREDMARTEALIRSANIRAD